MSSEKLVEKGREWEMKLVKVLLAGLLCFTLSACKEKEEKVTPMEEIDYRIESAGYKVKKTLDQKGNPIGMNITKKNFTLIFSEMEDKLTSITFINKDRNQYALDLKKKEARVILTIKNQLCAIDIDDKKEIKNPKECGKMDEKKAAAVKEDFIKFLKEIDITFEELVNYYNWNTSD